MEEMPGFLRFFPYFFARSRSHTLVCAAKDSDVSELVSIPILEGRPDGASSPRGVVRSERLSALDGPSGRSDPHMARDLLSDDALAEALK